MATGIANADTTTCYERTYTAEHMAAQPMQTFQSMKLKVIDGAYSYILVDAVSRYDKASYSFVAGMVFGQPVGTNWCADFAGDGVSYTGCVNLKAAKSPDEILLSPAEFMQYNDGVDDISTFGFEATRCEGLMTDGEGCVETIRTIRVSPVNKQDLNYKLTKVACK